MIATFGEALVDMIEQPDGSYKACLGGSVCNFTLGLARQGVAATYLNPLSSDRFGEQFASLLARNDVRLASSRSTCPTSLAVVGLDRQGVPTYAFYRDGVADRDLDAAQAAARFPERMEVLHTGGLAMVPEDIDKTLLVMAEAAARGALLSLDVNLRPVAVADQERYAGGVLKAMRQAHIIKMSDEDLAALGLARLRPTEVADTFFHQSSTELIALTLGARGAVLLSRTHCVALSAPPDLKVVDTVGAGDCFHAGLVAYLRRAGALSSAQDLRNLDQRTIESALRHAIAAASINVTRAGCQPPTWQETDDYALAHALAAISGRD